jgi:hypothetical protein
LCLLHSELTFDCCICLHRLLTCLEKGNYHLIKTANHCICTHRLLMVLST